MSLSLGETMSEMEERSSRGRVGWDGVTSRSSVKQGRQKVGRVKFSSNLKQLRLFLHMRSS